MTHSTSPFLIRGPFDDDDQEYLYWSNEQGWVDRESADFFSDESVVHGLPEDATGRVYLSDRARSVRTYEDRRQEAIEQFNAVLADEHQGERSLANIRHAIADIVRDMTPGTHEAEDATEIWLAMAQADPWLVTTAPAGEEFWGATPLDVMESNFRNALTEQLMAVHRLHQDLD